MNDLQFYPDRTTKNVIQIVMGGQVVGKIREHKDHDGHVSFETVKQIVYYNDELRQILEFMYSL